MSTQVLGEMLVRYTANISDLTAKVGQVRSELASAATAAQSSGSGMFSGFKQGINGALQFGAQIGQTVFGMQALAQGAISLGSALLEPNASMEQTTVGFETLMGKGQKTQAFLKDLQSFADATPFEFPQLSQDAEHMLAFGFAAKDIVPDLTDIGDAMGSMGKSNADIDALVTVFGQMKAAGKVNAQDMMQLTSQGIPAWKILAQAMHLSVSQVQDLSQKGLLPADQSIKMLLAGMEKMFGGGMAAQAQTFNGLLSTLQDKAGAAMRAFTGPLFDKAKQGLTQLGTIVSSKAFQDFATNVGEKLGTGLSTVANVIGTVSSGIGQFIGWLKAGSAPAIAVGIALAMIAGALAAVQIGAFIAAIPALVAGFIAWGVAAWSAAIATIAATWPLLAIGAAVVLVVALIVLAVQHWGQITKWLGDVWKGFSTWFMGLWNGMISWFKSVIDRFQGVLNVLKIALLVIFAPLILAIAAIAAPFVGLFLVITHFGQIMNWLKEQVNKAITFVVGLFLWLYEHNAYFQKLVDAIRKIITTVVAWLMDTWHNITSWIVAKWTWLTTMAVVVFTMIYVTVQSKINQVKEFIVSILTTILVFFINKFLAVYNTVTGFLEKVRAVFQNTWSTYIAGPLGALWAKISGWFAQLGKGALDAGANFINMLVSGIKNGAGAIWDAVSGIAGNIWKALGFHSPTKEGPGRTADKWMPSLVDMLASGLTTGAPKIQRAAYQVAAPLAQVIYPIRPSASAIAYAAGSGAGGSTGGQTVILEVDSVQLARINNRATDKLVRLKLASGGRAA
jgi:tape measure domain-containing protein